MSVLVIVGAQWGDEGKGGVVDHLAAQARIVARYQGGTNTGHTVVNDLGTFRLHLIPSGIFDPRVTCVIGTGVVVDPCALVEEIDGLVSAGVSVRNLFVSDRAHVVLPYHLVLDALEEEQRGEANLGTTRRGVGPAYADKVSRSGLRMCDLVDTTSLRERIFDAVALKNRLISGVYGRAPVDPMAVYETYRAFGERLKPHVVDTSLLIHEAIATRQNVLLEGAQATLLDNDYGTYPFVTSSSPTAGGACVGVGIGPTQIDRVVGVFKAYQTRVGAGPFPTELVNGTGDHLRERGQEFGTTTGRPRRCGWFDAVLARHAVRINGMQGAAITKLDVLDDLPSIRICTGYRLDGEIVNSLPASLYTFGRCEPIWEDVEGWRAPTGEARKRDDLPRAARRFVDQIGR